MYWHWDWGNIMFVVSALTGLVGMLFLFGFDMAEKGAGSGQDPAGTEMPQARQASTPAPLKKAA